MLLFLGSLFQLSETSDSQALHAIDIQSHNSLILYKKAQALKMNAKKTFNVKEVRGHLNNTIKMHQALLGNVF